MQRRQKGQKRPKDTAKNWYVHPYKLRRGEQLPSWAKDKYSIRRHIQ